MSYLSLSVIVKSDNNITKDWEVHYANILTCKKCTFSYSLEMYSLIKMNIFTYSYSAKLMR